MAHRSALAFLASAIFLFPGVTAAAGRATDGGVIVAAHIATGGYTVGGGTIVAQTGTNVRVITAAHVIESGAISVRFDDGSSADARLIARYPENDLAVIEADLSPAQAASVHPAPVGEPRSREAVHIWGSGYGGPALELASIARIGDALPDGPAHGRYALACTTCHRGDSGGGIFDAHGSLVGVYVGYFESDDAQRISVAEELPAAALKIARSNTSTAPSTIALGN